MIASDEIIVPQAGQGISDSAAATGSGAGADFATGFAAGAWAATTAGFAGLAGAGVGAGCGRTTGPGDGAGLAAGVGPWGVGAGAARADCSSANNCFSRSTSRFVSSATFARAAARLSSSAASF